MGDWRTYTPKFRYLHGPLLLVWWSRIYPIRPIEVGERGTHLGLEEVAVGAVGGGEGGEGAVTFLELGIGVLVCAAVEGDAVCCWSEEDDDYDGDGRRVEEKEGREGVGCWRH